VIGHVTDTGFVRIKRHGELAADLPAPLLADECPTHTTEFGEPEYHRKAKAFDPSSLPQMDLAESLHTLLSTPSLAGKRWVFQQYDQQVQTQTALRPDGGDAAVLAPRGTKKGLAVKIDGNGRWTYFDPYAGGCLAVVEAARNVACTGGRPAAATDGLNFGNPTHSHVFWQFERAVRGIADAAEALGTPVVSGNVSFYNQSDLGEILPTPMIGMLGILDDASKRVGMGFPAGICDLALVYYPHAEPAQSGIGASDFLAEVHGMETGVPVQPDLEKEKLLCHWLADEIQAGRILAAHDVSEGGSLFALAEMAIAGGIGGKSFSLDGDAYSFTDRADFAAFAELPGYVFICIPAGAKLTPPEGLRIADIGGVDWHCEFMTVTVKGQKFDLDVEELRNRRESVIPGLMGSAKS
jgi:phosphoribosylformylglycinamidine synthase